MKSEVLIIDDEDLFREDLATILREHGHECHTAPNGERGLELALEMNPDVVLCDLVMPGKGGIEVITELARICPESCLIVITAYGTLATAVEAFRKGASDYIMKPLVEEDVLQKIRRFLEYKRVVQEVRRLRMEVSRQVEGHQLIGESEAILTVRKTARKVAKTQSTVLITGESGTGKELVARMIHASSSVGKEGPFIAVNCASIPENLFESELFGHVKGAFTGADRDKPGLMEVAGNGTLFLDEVAEMSVGLQAKFLRAIEQKEFIRVGGTVPIKVDNRIIASTNRDLQSRIMEETFRKDLFYRLRVVEIQLPTLRKRAGDIPLLVEHFVRKCNHKLKRNFLGVDNEAMRILMAYPWPGNVRELENVIERAMILGDEEFIGIADLPPDITGSIQFPRLSDDLREAVKAYEREHIRRVISAANGVKEEAARRLGINASTLYRKMIDLGLSEP